MGHSHTQGRTQIPVQGRDHVPKLGTVAISGWQSVLFSLQCEHFFTVQL